HDLAVADPAPRIAGEPASRNPEVGEDVDQATFEVAQVEADIRRRTEIEDWIADQLASTVIGDVSAAVEVKAGDPARGEFGIVEKHVIAGATPAYRVGMRVLGQHQGVRAQPSTALMPNPALERPDFLVRSLL